MNFQVVTNLIVMTAQIAHEAHKLKDTSLGLVEIRLEPYKRAKADAEPAL